MKADEKLKHFFPERFEAKKHVILFPHTRTSNEKAYEHFLKKHKLDQIEVYHWDVQHERIPAGYVLVEASRGGNSDGFLSYWLVKREEFLKLRTEFGYIIRPWKDLYRELKNR